MDEPALRKSHIRLTLIMCSFVGTLLFASIIGEVDIAVKGIGRLIPDGQVKAVQSYETGTIVEILVREGASVKAGDVLIRLDPTEALADEQRTASDLATARVEFARLKATVDYEQGAKYDPPPDSPQHLVIASELLMRNQINGLITTVAEIDANIREKEAYCTEIASVTQKYKELLPILREREKARGELLKTNAVSRLIYLDDKERLLTMLGDLQIYEAKLVEAQNSLQSLRERRQNTILQFRTDRLTEFVEAQRKMLALMQDYSKTQERLRRHTILAPIDGTVQDMTIYTIGGVIKSGDRLVTIVPKETKLIAEAFVSTKDVGFVATGQNADIRISAFDYRIYGSIKGKVTSLSRDAATIDASSKYQPVAAATTPTLAQPSSLTQQYVPVFRAEITPERTSMVIDGQNTILSSGLSVEANILVARRRVIDFFLEPFQTYRYDAFRQRPFLSESPP
jgi:membrane fusion protein, hemolysin D